MIKRYSRPELIKVWSQQEKYKIWFEIEAYACEAMESISLIPEGTTKNVLKASVSIMTLMKLMLLKK